MPIKRRPHRGTDPDAGVLPLINVVFLLLVFFMVAGTLSARAPFDVTLPPSDSAQPAADQGRTVWIGPDGQIALGADTLDLAGFAAAARVLASESSGTLVRIEADMAAPADRLIAVVAVLENAGVLSLHVITQAGTGSGR